MLKLKTSVCRYIQITTIMSYFISFQDSQKSLILDNVESFVLLGYKTVIKFENGTQDFLLNVLGISAHYYNEG